MDDEQQCLRQLERTSAWLRSVPLANFARRDEALRRQARELILQVHTLVLRLSGGANSDFPPADAVPDELADFALGDQLAVHTRDLARALAAAATQVDGGGPGEESIAALTQAALALRVDNSNTLLS